MKVVGKLLLTFLAISKERDLFFFFFFFFFFFLSFFFFLNFRDLVWKGSLYFFHNLCRILKLKHVLFKENTSVTNYGNHNQAYTVI